MSAVSPNHTTWIERLKPQLANDETIVCVFSSDKNWTGVDDKADLYALVRTDLADGGVILYGYSECRGEWLANWSARHAMRYLLDSLFAVNRSVTMTEVSSVVRDTINGYNFHDEAV